MNSLLKRSASTCALFILFSFILFGPKSCADVIFNLSAVLFSACAVYEFGKILRQSGHPFPLKITVFLTAATVGFFTLGWNKILFIPFLVFTAYTWSLFLTSRNSESGMRKIFASAFVYFLFSIPFGVLIFLYNSNSGCGVSGRKLFVYLLLITKIGDIAAYATGSFSNFLLRKRGGNHKMIPSISPGKSYEGACGGLFFTILLSWILWPLCGMENILSQWASLLSGVILFFGGMAGDLAESSFKRTCRVKDSGAIFPGIGGMLDLLDSLLINAPLFLLFIWCAGVQW